MSNGMDSDHDQSLRKYGTRPGSDSQPLDLQLDTLLTALCSQVHFLYDNWEKLLILTLK